MGFAAVARQISGGADQWVGAFNQALWDEWSPKLWAYFNELKPCLWREGATYPKDENELHSLFAARLANGGGDAFDGLCRGFGHGHHEGHVQPGDDDEVHELMPEKLLRCNITNGILRVNPNQQGIRRQDEF